MLALLGRHREQPSAATLRNSWITIVCRMDWGVSHSSGGGWGDDGGSGLPYVSDDNPFSVAGRTPCAPGLARRRSECCQRRRVLIQQLIDLEGLQDDADVQLVQLFLELPGLTPRYCTENDRQMPG